jgi:Lon-like protease
VSDIAPTNLPLDPTVDPAAADAVQVVAPDGVNPTADWSAPPAPPAPPASAVRLPSKGVRLVGTALASLGLVGIATPIVAAVVPSGVVAEKQDCGLYTSDSTLDDLTCAEFDPVEAVDYAVVPASAAAVTPLLAVSGAETYPVDGDTYFVTVNPERKLNLLSWFVVRRNGAVGLRSELEVNPPDETDEQERERGLQQMRTAQESAEFVALLRAGYEPRLVLGEIVVADTCLQYDGDRCEVSPPSDKVLDPGDVLRSIDGVTLQTVEDLGAVLRGKSPGDVVPIVFERDGETIEAEIELTSSPDSPGRTLVGFVPFDNSTIEMPEGIEIDFDTGAIGGPSAGLSFSLALIDRLTPGSLTGGVDVAVTGTIDINGNVGAIGGLTSKASAVQQAGVRYMIVPRGQGLEDIEAARQVVGDDVEIIPVATLDEALEVLASLGGDPLPIQPSATNP